MGQGWCTLGGYSHTGYGTSQPRSTDTGALLTVLSTGATDRTIVSSLENDVTLFGQIYIARDGDKHSVAPTIAEYHLVVKSLAMSGANILTIGSSHLRAESKRRLVSFVLIKQKQGFSTCRMGGVGALLFALWRYHL